MSGGDRVSGTPISALSPTQGCAYLSQYHPNFSDALGIRSGFIEAPGWLVAPHNAGALPSLLEGVSGLGLHLSRPGCALQPHGMASKQIIPPAAAWFSALDAAHWPQNKLAVTSAEAGASGKELPASKRRNCPCKSIPG